jgi:hypothetical protein
MDANRNSNCACAEQGYETSCAQNSTYIFMQVIITYFGFNYKLNNLILFVKFSNIKAYENK